MGKLSWLLCVYVGLFGVLAVASYGLADPNFILVSHPIYWQFQQLIWSLVVQQPYTTTVGYGLILLVIWMVYLKIGQTLRSSAGHQMSGAVPKVVLAWVLILAMGLISYNYLSHDIFNYMFNAKMVWVYGADPHIHSALEFAQDPWVRFMHNTHTPAPYGYGWTILSLPVYWVGGGIFSVTWVLFRSWSIIGWCLALSGIYWWGRKTGPGNQILSVIWLAMSPLVLTEVAWNGHNDGWMMAGAVWGLWLIGYSTTHRVVSIVVGMLLLVASISVKMATLVLLPWAGLLIIVLFAAQQTKIKRRLPRLVDWRRWCLEQTPLIASILMILPLVLARSQWFHPWYLTWSLIWLPLLPQRWWRSILLGFSIASTFRYLPWLWSSGYSPTVINQQIIITWVGGIVASSIIWLVGSKKADLSQPIK